MHTTDALPEALRDALGQIIADQRREWRRERELIEAQSRETIAQLRAEIIELRTSVKEDVAARLAALRDGRDGKDFDADPLVEELRARISAFEELASRNIGERLSLVKDGRNGEDADIAPLWAEFDKIKAATDENVKFLGCNLIDQVNARLAEVKDGKDGKPGVSFVDAWMVDGELLLARSDLVEINVGKVRGEPGAPGKLPVAKEWTARVHYEGDVVTHAGATYQALRDTGGAPPGEDWQALAAKGADARPFIVRGTFDPQGEYEANDVVACNKSSFIALKNNPGACPGDGWQLLAGAGSRGEKGPPGERIKGDRGPSGASIIAANIDGMSLVLTDSEGEQFRADLAPIAEQILAAVR